MVSLIKNTLGLKCDEPSCCEQDDNILLCDLPAGSKGVIRCWRMSVREGCTGEHCKAAGRLRSMGLTEGAEIEVVSTGDFGPVIVKSGESRIAVGRGMSSKIVIEKI